MSDGLGAEEGGAEEEGDKGRSGYQFYTRFNTKRKWRNKGCHQGDREKFEREEVDLQKEEE